jgi:ABC-type polysaccharide/polyol phosphate export permease
MKRGEEMRKLAALFIVVYSMSYMNILAYGQDSAKATIVPAGDADIQALLSAIFILLILALAAILIFRRDSRSDTADTDK